MTQLANTLNRLEAMHGKKHIDSRRTLKVYYGWAKLNKVQKREALTVIYVNDNVPPRIGKDDFDGVTKFMIPVYVRNQTSGEMEDAKQSNRLYTVFSMFVDDKHFHGDLQALLKANDDADKNNVSDAERRKIFAALQTSFMETHPDYKQPVIQLSLNF